MIITQTPVRISFLGGGTDYPEYFHRHGGETLVATINKYTLVTVHGITQFADHAFRIHYSQVESVATLDEIQHPSARECLRFLGVRDGIEIHYLSNLPARTGLGSSASATVGLLHALHAFKGELVTREQLAEEAVHVERELIKEHVGCQDQYACSFGGLLHLEFCANGSVKVGPATLPESRRKMLEERLMLFYTGAQRNAHELLGEQIQRTLSEQIDGELGCMRKLVRQGLDVLSGEGDLAVFGELLHEGWTLKRRLSSKVTTPWIDRIYERARGAGAVGGKLLGAGGGGFLLLYVEPPQREAVRRVVPELREAPFAFEQTGSTIIFYRP